MQTQTHNPNPQLHKTGQFLLEHNVEYKIVNRFKFAELLATKGINISEAAIADLDLIKQEAVASGLSIDEVEKLADSCGREIFTENAIGKKILKGIREFVKEPLTADGVVKKGFMNHLAAYGVQIPGLTGNFGRVRIMRNLVTNAGFAGIASRINGSGAEAAFVYIAMGTGTTAANVTDTTLVTELAASGLSRVSSTASRVTTTVTNDTAQLVNTFSVTGSVAVTESGVLNAASTGTLLCRQVFSAINVVNGDSLQVTWKVKAS